MPRGVGPLWTLGDAGASTWGESGTYYDKRGLALEPRDPHPPGAHALPLAVGRAVCGGARLLVQMDRNAVAADPARECATPAHTPMRDWVDALARTRDR